MHPLVRDLYKRIIHVGREYPLGLSWVKSKAKPWFLQNKNVDNEIELKQKIAIGRHQVKEMEAVIKLKKYRHLKNTYYNKQDEEDSSMTKIVDEKIKAE
jgi:hypothetical protein